jgi:hypothetical protein
MSNDPFGQFSKIFTTEFGKAAMSAWQETLAKSFAQSFGETSANIFSSDAQSPMYIWQEMLKKSISQGPAQYAGQQAAQESWQSAWAPIIQGMTGGAKSASEGTPFDFFQQFMRQFSGAQTADFGGGAAYLQFGQFIQKYLDLLATGTDPSKLAEQMSSAFQNSLGELGNVDLMAWMSKVAQSNGPEEFLKTAGEILKNSPFAQSSSFDFSVFSKAGSSAAVGPGREWQKAMVDVAKAHERSRNAQVKMCGHTNETFKGASEKFWRELGHGHRDGDREGQDERELTSLREIYDYWVDCAEHAYHDIVMTDDYARDFGEMINSQSALKKKVTALLNRFLEMLNIPNRREIDAVIGQLSAITLRLDTMEQNIAFDRETDNATMIDALRKELARLRSEMSVSREIAVTPAVDNVEELPSVKTRQPCVLKTEKPPSRARSKKKKETKATTNTKAQAQAPKKPKGDKRAEFDITKITSSS